MTFEQGRIPPGPAEKYDTSEDLLRWMNDQFDRFGSIYRASVMVRTSMSSATLSTSIMSSESTGKTTKKVKRSNVSASFSAMA